MKKYIFILCALAYSTLFVSQTIFAAQAAQEKEVNLDDDGYDSDDDECLKTIPNDQELNELYTESKKATLNTVIIRLTKKIELLETAIKDDKANTKLIEALLKNIDELFEKADKKATFSDKLNLSEQDRQVFATLLAPISDLSKKCDQLENSLNGFFGKTFTKDNLIEIKDSISAIIASKPCKYVLIACAIALSALASFYIGYGLSYLYHTPTVQAALSKALLALSTALAEWKKNRIIQNFATCATSQEAAAGKACIDAGLIEQCEEAFYKLHPRTEN